MISLQLPEIPDKIDSEGILAILFLILIGAAVLLFVVSKGYLALGRSDMIPTATMLTEIQALNSNLKSLSSDIKTIETIAQELRINVLNNSHRIDDAAQELRAARANIQNNVMPSLAGLTLAYLRLSGFKDLASEEVKRLKKSGIEPKDPL